MLERLLDASCTLQAQSLPSLVDPPAGAFYDPLMHRLATLVPALALAASAALAQPRAEQDDPSALTPATARLGRAIWAPVTTLDRSGVDPFVLRFATAPSVPVIVAAFSRTPADRLGIAHIGRLCGVCRAPVSLRWSFGRFRLVAPPCVSLVAPCDALSLRVVRFAPPSLLW